jgi:amino acid adenylation domain-containing protein
MDHTKADSPEILLQNLLDARLIAGNDSIAIKEGDRVITYSELTVLVDSIAAILSDLGVKKGHAVPIYANRSIEVLASILAIIRIGGFYVPISNDIPPARVGFICQDVVAKLLLTDSATEKKNGEITGVSILQIDTLNIKKASKNNRVDLSSDDIAYVIYTSGTTGAAKGVIIEHGAIAKRFFDWDKRFQLTEKPLSILQVSNLGFDVFTGDWVKALCSGGCIVFCDFEQLVNPRSLFELIVDEHIDYVDIVPAVVRTLVDYLEQIDADLRSLSFLNCGSDKWSKEEYFRFKSILKVPHLVNGYGVTECSVESFTYEDTENVLTERSALPIGKPLSSDSFIIVDQALNPVGLNTRGEICIGGPCIARGYINQPELDREKFFYKRNRFSEPVRYYRTGDIGSLSQDGNVDFFGRSDYQVKLHGHRIELHEIEIQLEKHFGVKKTVAFVNYEKSTIVAMILKSDHMPFSKRALLSEASRQLPRYMIPSELIEIDEFPLTSNGKIDRQALEKSYKSGLKNKLKLRKKIPTFDSLPELINFLDASQLDIRSLVNEFVKFNKKVAIAVLETSAFDDFISLKVFSLDSSFLKRKKTHILGSSISYKDCRSPSAMLAEVTVNGVFFKIEFVFLTTSLNSVDPAVQAVEKEHPLCLNISDEKIADDWVYDGLDIIKAWRNERRYTSVP